MGLMGLIGNIVGVVFGGGRNVLRETAEVFTENAEARALRALAARAQAMEQFGAEFAQPRQGMFDRFMDGVNRLPRPALALGTLGLFVAAMVDPIWFAARMQGIALVPEPLWWLLGVIVSFYFGARHQRKSQDFQRDIAATMARAPVAAANIAALQSLRDAPAFPEIPDVQATAAHGDGQDAPQQPPQHQPAQPDPSPAAGDSNPALEDWKALRAGRAAG